MSCRLPLLALAIFLVAACERSPPEQEERAAKTSTDADERATTAPSAPAEDAEGGGGTRAPVESRIVDPPTTTDISAAPSAPAPNPEDLVGLMRTEIGPRLGKEDERAELVRLLSSIPDYAPPELKAEFQAVVGELPTNGTLVATCKACHINHRLRFRVILGKLPGQKTSPTDESNGKH